MGLTPIHPLQHAEPKPSKMPSVGVPILSDSFESRILTEIQDSHGLLRGDGAYLMDVPSGKGRQVRVSLLCVCEAAGIGFVITLSLLLCWRRVDLALLFSSLFLSACACACT